MTSPLNQFNGVARMYDILSRIVFGNAIRKAQLCFIDSIKDGSNVLILGGGSGWYLQQLRFQKKAVKVWFIDASSRMIQLARTRSGNPDHVSFIHGTEQDIPSTMHYDVVVLHFFLDLFTDESLETVLNAIEKGCDKSTVLIVSEFTSGMLWKRLLLNVMYAFFNLVCGLKTTRLPQWETTLKQRGWVPIQTQGFYGGFIVSQCYARTGK